MCSLLGAGRVSSGPADAIAELSPAESPSGGCNCGRSATRRCSQPRTDSPLAQQEKEAILETLRKLNGDKILAARLLGIGKTTLYRKLKEYGINSPEPPPDIENHRA